MIKRPCSIAQRDSGVTNRFFFLEKRWFFRYKTKVFLEIFRKPKWRVLLPLLVPPCVATAQGSLFPEEPDYAFVTGSPYTESQKFLQIILTNIFTQTLDAGGTDLSDNTSIWFMDLGPDVFAMYPRGTPAGIVST